jgi:hypothetical protein
MAGLDRTLPHVSSSFACVPASVRLGAVRYRCPDSGSYVLLTDPAALKRLSMRPVHCAGCGGEHRLLCTEDARVDSAA